MEREIDEEREEESERVVDREREKEREEESDRVMERIGRFSCRGLWVQFQGKYFIYVHTIDRH